MQGLDKYIGFIFDSPTGFEYLVNLTLVFVDRTRVIYNRWRGTVGIGQSFESVFNKVEKDLNLKVVDYCFWQAGIEKNKDVKIPVIEAKVRVEEVKNSNDWWEEKPMYLPFLTEALSYLNDPKVVPGLTSVRFKDKNEAIEFVKKLYEEGAIEVRVILKEATARQLNPNEEISSISILLPRNKEKRKKLFDIWEKEGANYEEDFYLNHLPFELKDLSSGPEILKIYWDKKVNS